MQNKHGGRGQQGPRKPQPLPLPARELDASLTDERIEPAVNRRHNVGCVDGGNRGTNRLVVVPLPRVKHLAQSSAVEEWHRIRDSESSTQLFFRERFEGPAVQQDGVGPIRNKPANAIDKCSCLVGIANRDREQFAGLQRNARCLVSKYRRAA